MTHTTEDGKNFKDLEAAMAHEAKINNIKRKAQAEEILKGLGTYTKKQIAEVVNFLLAGNAGDIRAVLDVLHPIPAEVKPTAVKARKPRTPKAAKADTGEQAPEGEKSEQPVAGVRKGRGRPRKPASQETPSVVVTTPPATA